MHRCLNAVRGRVLDIDFSTANVLSCLKIVRRFVSIWVILDPGANSMKTSTEKKSIKIAHLFIENLNHSFESDFKFPLDDNATLVISVGENDAIRKLEESVWREWVGTIEWDSLKRSNAILAMTCESQNPEIQDHENQSLLDKIQTAWVALKCVAPIHTDHCYKTTGYTDGEKIRINHYDQLAKWYLPGFDDRSEEVIGVIERMDEERARQWQALYRAMRFIQSRRKQDEYLRVWLGLRAFEKACNEYFLEYRLPFFVRALEALILPERGKTERQFKSRAGKWWEKSINPKIFLGDPHKILGEIYEMRCDFDHLHGLKEAYTETQHLRAYQCEQLTRRAYRDILLNRETLILFKNNEGIQDYWRNS